MEESQDEVHPEDRELVAKLAKLQDMHQQITDLRGLLPERLLRPTRMALENPRGVSPEKLAANLKIAASDGSRDIQRFVRGFQSPEVRELFQKTSTSDVPQGRDSWVVDYQRLANRLKSDSTVSNAQPNGKASTEIGASEDEDAVLKTYSNADSVLKIERASQTIIYPITVGIGGLSFRIVQQEQSGRKTLTLEAKPDSEPHNLEDEIVRNFKDIDKTYSLEALLSMLATYHDLKFKKCEKCQNIFDGEIKYALVRKQKSSTIKDSKSMEWEVSHRSCARLEK